MSGEQVRQMADRLRAIPLSEVLRLWEARPDRQDKAKWHTSRGTLSVNGTKFINWNCGTGGGGAIDLVIHLMGESGFHEALHWLQTHFDHGLSYENSAAAEYRSTHRILKLPKADPAQLHRVRSFLVRRRSLPAARIDPLIASGTLYADRRANAVFLLLGKEKATAVGAELRGTGSGHWRGMAQGSRKDKGYFCASPRESIGGDPLPIILCESAIDALSCLVLHPDHCSLSTSGAHPNPAWLRALIEGNQGHPIYCGYDADETGERMARTMIAIHPEITRLRPQRHDWNALLSFEA